MHKLLGQVELALNLHHRVGRRRILILGERVGGPFELPVGAIVSRVRGPPRMLRLELCQQLVQQRVCHTIWIVLVGNCAARETVGPHVDVHAVALIVDRLSVAALGSRDKCTCAKGAHLLHRAARKVGEGGELVRGGHDDLQKQPSNELGERNANRTVTVPADAENLKVTRRARGEPLPSDRRPCGIPRASRDAWRKDV